MSLTFLAWGVGQGKTKAALDLISESGCKQLIVYAPSVLKTIHHWENEATKWGVDIPMEVHSYYDLQKIGKGEVNHKLVNSGDGVSVVIDEAHKIKNSQSLQGLGAFKLVRDNPQADFYLLSGTPAPNGYQDFCNYAKMTGLVRNKTDFFDRYCIISSYRGFPEIKAYRNTAELDDWWQEIADIKPPVIFSKEHDIWVNFPSVVNELYAKKVRIGITGNDKVALDNASQLTHYCRQAACLTKVRRDWLENMLDSTDDNVVVFVSYKLSMLAVLEIANRLHKTIYRVDGDIKILPDESQLNKITNSVTVINYQAGGSGLNLQYANHAVFYNPTYSYSDYIQARGRISRRGQEKLCTFYHLQADRSIERDIYDCLNNKKDFNIKLWGDKYKTDDYNNDILFI